MPWWAILIIVAAIALVLFFAVVLIYARRFTVVYFSRHRFSAGTSRRRRKKLTDSEENYRKFLREAYQSFSQKPFEPLEIITHDDLKLTGRLYRAQNPVGKTVLCVHGYCSSGLKEFSAVAPFLLTSGCNVLLVDNRAHGDSEGNIIGFGIKDSLDVTAWLGKLVGVFPRDEIYLYGVSMGSSAVLMTTEFDLPECVKGIIADCGFTSPYEQFCYLFRSIAHFPPCLIVSIIRKFARKFAGYDIKSVDTRKLLPETQIPVLLIHGTADKFVPIYMSRQNAAANPEKAELFEVSGAKHAASYYCATAEYENKLSEFMGLK